MLEKSKQEATMAWATTSRAIGTVGVWQTFGKTSLPSSYGYHLLFEQEPDIQEDLQIVDQLKLRNSASRQNEMGKSPDVWALKPTGLVSVWKPGWHVKGSIYCFIAQPYT